MNNVINAAVKPPLYMYRFVFKKTGSICFVGHLDIMTAFRRAFKRAKLPVWYTTGFNPHMDISIAMPLPLGMTGFCEYGEVMLTEKRNAGEIAELLNDVLPDGITVLSAEELSEKSKSAAALVNRAEYEVNIGCSYELIRRAADAFLEKDEVKIMKNTKSGIAETDIRPDVFSLEAVEDDGKAVVTMVISAGSERNVKPEHIVKCLLSACDEIDGTEISTDYSRKKLLLVLKK